jgi:pimeloyl-ACP methyl ester carboxylesterase
MKARLPDRSGTIEKDGLRLYYESYGEAERTLMFLPTWTIVHARQWKAQLPYFARHFRVVTFDGPGNGGSDRPTDPARYDVAAVARYALAIMDATGTERAGLVALSIGAQWALELAARHPERVSAAAFIGPTVPLDPTPSKRLKLLQAFDEPQSSYDGWHKYNRHYWEYAYADFVRYFFSQAYVEPHSTKQREDCVGWGLQTTNDVLAASVHGATLTEQETRARAAAVRCPVLVIHGDDDRISPHGNGAALAEATGGVLLTMEGSGHLPHTRDPVKVNLALREFFAHAPAPATWRRAQRRRKRALYISSPIGLGHAQRDVAIAKELRMLHPGLQIDWLAQHPVTKVLEANGERIHPASALLASESAHIEEECGEHDLWCFEALRRMDEILVANFMVFHDLVCSEDYDLWITDEAWDVDYFLHENPELKRAPYVWMTDFVGYLPMPEGGSREAELTADYNAEMLEHVERHPALRDRAIFVGSAEDVVPASFGPGLPQIRDWTERHYAFSGFVTGFDPLATSDREALRARFGYGPHEKVCIVTVGGSGVGIDLLRRVIGSYPSVKRTIPDLRMIAVAGPRIDPGALPAVDGVEVHGYVPHLYERLAACDLAVVQGGLTTTMELAANSTPFIYVPLRRHFEQNYHVRHRLERYGAGRCMEYDTITPETIGTAIVHELSRPVAYRPVETDGARRAAELIGTLL